ncbi:MAG TPA: class I SAM-dependent methyltransferase [Planctomycetota bacterium]|nr:class I SAM-dependent methyltransferase [Planctomycetota bacterium]
MHPDRERWNAKHAAGHAGHGANVRLIMYRDRLAPGRALDVAAGAGENAAILALGGWKVVACDLSDNAIARARQRAAELRADLALVQADALHLPFRPASFDTVVCTYFLERDAARRLPTLLKPGGTLFFMSHLLDHRKYIPELPPQYCLEPGEVATLFPDLAKILHREEDDGQEAYGLFIGRRA